jgi:starvation-inducible DNA-binding protein
LKPFLNKILLYFKGGINFMEKTAKALNELLCDLNVLFRKLQNYHWNITGKEFFEIHEKLEEYYNCIAEKIDEVAEQIAILGYQPLGTMKDYLEFSQISEASNTPVKVQDIIPIIIKDFEILLSKFTMIKEHCDKEKVYITSSLMDEYISDYSKKLWMLKTLNK